MIDWTNPQWSQIGKHFGLVLVILTGRYLVIAGGAFLYFWKWRREVWQDRRIQLSFPKSDTIRQEIKYSLITTFIFGLVSLFLSYGRSRGWFLIYKDISEYGWIYFACSIIASVLLHDAYFYFAHRLMHTKWLFKHVHRVHHLSHNPTPFAAFSFHPTEAVLEAAILPLLLLFLPMHVSALLVFMFLMTSLNVLGHLGYEVYPARFVKSKWTSWNNTSTHHNMHHHFVHCNYGLYFNWWDKLFKTNHPDYISEFEKVTSRSQTETVGRKAA
ncbi:MAG: sterol desaturase family protein [Spirochaetia bacterium]|nr:sterol desaturase family protein [Spirochaetia bacterium]